MARPITQRLASLQHLPQAPSVLISPIDEAFLSVKKAASSYPGNKAWAAVWYDKAASEEEARIQGLAFQGNHNARLLFLFFARYTMQVYFFKETKSVTESQESQ